jgi:hypothetical protein
MVIKLEEKDEIKKPLSERDRMIAFFKQVVEHLESGNRAVIDLDEQRLKRAKLKGDKWPLFLRYLADQGEYLLSRELEEVKQVDFNVSRNLLRMIVPSVLAISLSFRKKELERFAAKFFNVPEYRIIISESKDA